MSFNYKNPKSSVVLSGPNSVNTDSNTGSNFSSFQVGGFYEVFKLSDLNFTIPSGATGTILYSGNTIPIDFSYNAPNGSPNVINLYSDGISSGRRKLGMIAYVYENNKTYQYQIPDYETLFNNALTANSVVNIDFGYQVYDNTNEGQLLLNAWTGSTIEGISGITRENARWVEYNPSLSANTITSLTGITTSQTLTWDYQYYGVSASTIIDLILPSATNRDGQFITIKDESSTAHLYRIRITPSSGLIDNYTYIDMNIKNMSLNIMARNDKWFLI
jgi:hypothetical protein